LEEIRFDQRDVLLAGDRIARPDAPLVILSPGGGQTRHSWRGAAPRIAEMGFEVISLDLRGHGDSGWSDAGYQLRDFGADIAAVANAFRAGRRVGLVGASLGGLASLLAAGNPANAINLLALVDVVPRVEPAGAMRIRSFMQSHPEGFDSLEQAAQAVSEYRGRTETDHSGLARNLRTAPSGKLVWHWDPSFMGNRHIGSGGVDDLEGAAASYPGPLLLVRGLQSDVVSDEGISALRELAPQLEEANVSETGHMVVGDRNEAFLEAIAGFLKTRLLAAPAI
jgi:non-heme chloroperoxidase